MLKKGERAPEFTLPDDQNRDQSLTDLLDGSALILFFFPASAYPIGARHARLLRGIHPKLTGAGLRIAGISPQAPALLAKFRARLALPFTLLSDPEKSVIRMYGVDGPLGLGVRRATYLIEPSRHVRGWLIADFAVGRHADFVNQAILIRELASRRRAD